MSDAGKALFLFIKKCDSGLYDNSLFREWDELGSALQTAWNEEAETIVRAACEEQKRVS